jgi:UPF0755 protein
MQDDKLKFKNYFKDKLKYVIDYLNKDKNQNKRFFLVVIFIVFIIFSVFYFTTLRAPDDFPVGRKIKIEEGMTLSEISGLLKQSSVIRSEIAFEVFVTIISSDSGALHGDYFFNKRTNLFNIAKKITKGEYGLTPIQITIPEGSTIYDIARLFEDNFLDFDSVAFLESARDKEGYLFPDTYLFLPNVEVEQVINEMQDNFKIKINEIKNEIIAFNKPLEEIVIMASILEKEARTMESRKMISGILWKRIDIGMPLQVDAVFPYINGKNTYTLTLEDLKVDSLYNTYKYKGLPVGPIANPGLDSLLAAVTPKKSPYFYYLSDKTGNIHYSRNFEEHKRNKKLYLN